MGNKIYELANGVDVPRGGGVFKVNDDGSVTMSGKEAPLSPQEQNILDILKIEKTKGGPYASVRMKKRALKYAKSVGIEEFVVEKLMMEHFKEDLEASSRAASILTLRIIGWIAIILGAYLAFMCIYFLMENFEYYIQFNSGDFKAILTCAVISLIIGSICLKKSKPRNN